MRNQWHIQIHLENTTNQVSIPKQGELQEDSTSPAMLKQVHNCPGNAVCQLHQLWGNPNSTSSECVGSRNTKNIVFF